MTEKSPNEMENDEFLKLVVEGCLKGWVPLASYLRWFPGETKIGVEARIKRKHWMRGVHYSTPKGSRMWVNVVAIGEWVSNQDDWGPTNPQ